MSAIEGFSPHSLSPWQAAQFPIRRPSAGLHAKSVSRDNVMVRGRSFVGDVLSPHRAQAQMPEHLFFGASMEANRNFIEWHKRSDVTAGIATTFSCQALLSVSCILAGANLCVLGATLRWHESTSPLVVIGLGIASAGCVFAAQRMLVARTSRDTRLTLHQLYDIYQAHEVVGHDPSRAIVLLYSLEQDRHEGRLHAPAVRALNEFHAFLLNDQRPEVRELALRACQERNRRELLS